MSAVKIACILAAAAAVPSVQAGQIWDGGGADSNWNTTANWDSNTLPTFTNAINFNGSVRLTPANNLTADSTIGGINFTNTTANAFTLSGNRITLGGNIVTSANTTGSTITDIISLDMILNGDRTITTNQLSSSVQHNLRVNGVISETGGARAFTKTGSGVLTLTGANTYTGTTVINDGTLNLGGGTATGSLASTVLTLGGGSLSYTRTGGTTQSFTTTNINSGGSAQLTVATGNTLNLGTVVRSAGGALDFGTVGAGTVAALAASNDASGIMPGFTFGDSWAVANGAGVAISSLGSYTLTSVAGATAANYAGLNIDVDSNAGPMDAAVTANSLRFSAAGANSMSLTGTNVITSGGILIGSAVGANLSTISGGTLAGAASKDLAVIQNNTAGGLTISSVIGNNTGATALTKSGGGLLNLGAANTFTGGVFIHGGTVALGNAGALNSNAVTFGPASTGTLALTGNSVVIANLSTNATPGTTFVQNANGSSVANATLTIGNASNLSGTYAGIIQDGTGGGSLALTKAGTGTLTLPSANTYSGGTTLSAGTVAISNATSFGTGGITVSGNSRINATGGITYANPINVNTGTTLTMQNPAVGASSTATFSGVLSGAGIISLPNSGSNGILGIIAFTNTANTFTGNVVLSATGSGDEFFVFNSIGDGGNFTFAKNGNRQGITYTGSTPIAFANRQIVVAASMVNGGATDRQGMDGGNANPVSTFANDGTGTITFNADMVVNNITSAYGALYFGGTNSGNNTFAGKISDTSGASQLSIGKIGTGTWILTGSNTYEGNTLIAGGILSVGTIADAATAQPLGKGAGIQLGVGNSGASGTLAYTGGAASTNKQIVIGSPVNTIAQAAAGSLLNNGSGALTFTNSIFNPTSASYIAPGGSTPTGGAVSVTRTLTLGGSYTGGTNEIQGVIQNNNTAGGGLVGLTVSGSAWMLSATNTYTGGTIVNAPGTLILSGNNTVSPTTGSLTINNTTFQLQANAGNTSAGISSAVGYATGSSAANASPGLSVGTTGSTFQLRSDSAVTFAGTSGIAGLSGKTVTINVGNNGTGTNNALTFSPNGNVFGGTNTFNITGSNGYSLILGAFNSNNTGGTQTFNPTTASVSIAGIGSNSATGSLQTIALSGTALGNTMGAITKNGTRDFAVTKSGVSAWTLTGTSTYTGDTNVNAGTLRINGSLDATSVLVNNTGRLEGTGSIAGPITINSGGSVAPGNSVGTLTTGAETWNGGGSYVWEINNVNGTAGADPGWDLIQMGGNTLTINATNDNGTTKFTIVNGGPATLGPDWLTIAVAGNILFGANAVNGAGGNGTVVGASFDTSVFALPTDWSIRAIDIGDPGSGGSGHGYAIQVSAVPEPGSIALLALAGLGLLSRRRRRATVG